MEAKLNRSRLISVERAEMSVRVLLEISSSTSVVQTEMGETSVSALWFTDRRVSTCKLLTPSRLVIWLLSATSVASRTQLEMGARVVRAL